MILLNFDVMHYLSVLLHQVLPLPENTSTLISPAL